MFVKIRLEKSEELLLKADFYRFLSIAFNYPERGKAAKIRMLANELMHAPFCRKEINLYIDILEKLCDETKIIESHKGLNKIMENMFVESAILKKNNVTDVQTYYSALNFNPKKKYAPDSINNELYFASFMNLKIVTNCDNNSAELSTAALEAFLSDHLIDFGLKLADKIKSTNQGGYFYYLANLLEFVMLEEKSTIEKLNLQKGNPKDLQT